MTTFFGVKNGIFPCTLLVLLNDHNYTEDQHQSKTQKLNWNLAELGKWEMKIKVKKAAKGTFL